MSTATSIAARQVYGVQRVCAAWGFPRASFYASAPLVPPNALAPAAPGKRGPKTVLDDAALLALMAQQSVDHTAFFWRLADALSDNHAAVRELFVQPQVWDAWAVDWRARVQQQGQTLDQALKKANADYDAKRKGNINIGFPLLTLATKGTFHSWLKQKGKLGGQHKVPRLQNTPNLLQEIMRCQ
jgi:hypothetical protein